MNSSFPNRWSFNHPKSTKYVTNIIGEPKHKYGQQEQATEVPPWNGQYKNTGGWGGGGGGGAGGFNRFYKPVDRTFPFHYQRSELFGLLEEICIESSVAF